jgi:HEAT repeat protein
VQPVPARLAAIAGSDRVPGVRRRALEIVSEKYGKTAYAAEAARRALADPDSGVRAQAAPLESNGAADDAVAAGVRDEHASEKDRRDALARAAAVLDRDEMIALYDVAMSSKLPALQRDGISGFARLRHGPGIPRLAKLSKETDDELTLTDLADALAAIAGPGAEEALLAMLDIAMPPVQVEAARGLAKIGSPSAIARLKPMAAVVIGPPDVREAAADAIAAIRTRYPGAAIEEPGAKKERT